VCVCVCVRACVCAKAEGTSCVRAQLGRWAGGREGRGMKGAKPVVAEGTVWAGAGGSEAGLS